MAGRVVEVGRLDTVSLFARFDFTRAALPEAFDRWIAERRRGPSIKPREVATYTHELAHYLQYTTTPYGLFLQWCRTVQNQAIIDLVRTLLHAGCPIRLPLLYNLPAMSPVVAERARIPLSIWLNVEDLILLLNGDFSRRRDLIYFQIEDMDRTNRGLNRMRPDLLGPRQTFLQVQKLLANMIDNHNAKMRSAGPIPMYPEVVDRDAIKLENDAEPSGTDLAIEKLLSGFDMISSNNENWLGVAGIIESAATAAEFWGTGIGYAEFAAWASADVPPHIALYRRPLATSLDTIKTTNLEEFLLTYLTICEWSLFAPLLPQHARLRLEKPNFVQLMPLLRYRELMSAAGKLMPMRSRQDHLRYMMELFSELNWVMPSQIVANSLEGPSEVADPITHIYQSAQLWRGRSATTFIGVDGFLIDSSHRQQNGVKYSTSLSMTLATERRTLATNGFWK